MSAPTITPTNGTDTAALLRAAQGKPAAPTQRLPMGIRVITGPGATPAARTDAPSAPAARPLRTLDQLLTLAQGSEAARTRQLAEKITSLVDELTGRLEAELAAVARQLAAKEAELATELAAVRQQMGTGSVGTAQRLAIRQWAQANGYEVAERGRIPRNVLQAWATATATGSEVTR
ncbi:Lsr2 family protein (plasmid) [Micromonospora sp. NBC_00821]|uniref:Lsr2 family DNA-binding protein n=1 Tax=Micromonospora sp. NBC_00821 TaxID=2975977 RepID=UPI002ED4237F|nr:Lsr2 family protein [Micromonospora sp. NBC_00821]